MQGAFEFESRDECVCGAALVDSRERVVKQLETGDVIFLRCGTCGSWCQSPMLTEFSLARWIDSEHYQGSSNKAGVAYVNYAADEENRVLEARDRYCRDLAPLLAPRSRLLEIGCATGSLLAVVREHGHDVSGIDLSPKFAEAASSLHRLDVKVGDFLDTDFPAQQFDVVLAMGTISNFRKLSACMEKIRAILKPSGFVLFNFPAADSGWVRLLYRERFWMFTPSAITFMTVKGCREALRRAGFSSARVTNDVQRPSMRKLLHHGKADFLLPALTAVNMADALVPFSFPVPTVRLVVARISGR